MKKHILTLLCLAFGGIYAQSDFEKKYFEQAYTDTFRNESVVIARMMEEYSYTPLGLYDYKVQVVFRAQYILKDASAINSFSTLSKNKNLKRYELRQIKPDGKTAVIFEYLDKNYPDDGYELSPEDEKEKEKENEEIPLEDLSIGDIIDYKYEYTYTTRNRDPRKFTLENGKFDQVSTDIKNTFPYRDLLYKAKFPENKYPVASSVYAVHVPDELKLIQKTTLADYAFISSNSGGKTTYACYVQHLASFKAEEFSFYIASHPCIKYTLVQSNAGKMAVYPYQFESGKPVKDAAAALIKKMYSDKAYISDYLYYLNTQKYDLPYKQVSLSDFFSTFNKTFPTKSKTEKLNRMHEYLVNNDKLNPKYFGDMAYAIILARYCDYIGLGYKLMAALHRYDSRWEDLISPYEISWGIYVPAEKDLFICNYEENSNIYRRYGSLSGTDLLLVDPKDKTGVYTVMPYPEQKPQDNSYVQTAEFKLSDEAAFQYTASNTYTVKGEQKYVLSDYIADRFSPKKLRTDYKFFGLLNYGEIYDFKKFDSNEEWYKEARRIDSSYNLYFNNYYDKKMLGFLYDEYHLKEIKLDSAVIDNAGDFPDDETVQYGFKAHFKVNGLYESGLSDSVLVFHLGRLATEQFKLPSYRVGERRGDVHISNLKDIRWSNRVELPTGYSCLNLDEFNVLTDNNAGLFKTSAVLDNGHIVFEVIKMYKTAYLPASQWMDMVEFLHAAESMFMKKLLLKKG